MRVRLNLGLLPRVVVPALLVSLSSLILLGRVTSRLAERTIIDMLAARNSALISSAIAGLSQYFDDLIELLRLQGSQIMDQESRSSRQSMLTALRANRSYAFGRMQLLDPVGRALLEISGTLDEVMAQGAIRTDAPDGMVLDAATTRALKTGLLSVSRPRFSEFGVSPSVVLTLPLVDRGGRSRGALAVEIDMRSLWERLDAYSGFEGVLTLADASGAVLVSSDRKRIGSSTRIEGLEEAAAGEHLSYQATQGGQRFIIDVAPVGRIGDWVLIVERDMREAWSFTRSVRLQTAVFLLLAATAVVAILSLVAGHSLKPVKRLSLAVSRIAGTGDISGATLLLPRPGNSAREVETLIDSFNAMIRTLGTVQDSLREKNDELERFTYTIAHDLKSPMVTIKTFLGYLEKDLGESNSSRVEEDKQYLHKAADKMVRLLDELLEMSRIGRVVNPPVRVAFAELVSEVRETLAGALSTRGVQVFTDDAPIVLTGDRSRLVEIWQNLVENAVKFMGDQPSPRIEVGVENRDRDAVFFVRDNGMGIDPKYHQKVFGLFEKLNPACEGTGLGLALVKRIVEMYQGAITLESRGLGQGTCFRFTLPLAVEDQREGAHA
jgi:signal transduction histidine kinase